jgi:hypothetical protein
MVAHGAVGQEPGPESDEDGAAEWGRFGFGANEAESWRERGLGPFEAALSRDDGFTYANENVHADRRWAARTRKRWEKAGFDLEEARRWRQWMFSPAQARRWRIAGYDLAQASAARARGLRPGTPASRARR